MIRYNIDNLDAAIELAADLGFEFCPGCLAADLTPAGTLNEPPNDAGDLEAVAAAMLELLLGEVDDMSVEHHAHGAEHLEVAARRVAVLARLTLAVLPPVFSDVFGRHTLKLNDDGLFPSRTGQLDTVVRFAAAAASYLREHDAGDWVDPNAVAGAVADICDATLNLIRLCELKQRG